ncbi:MAG: PIN domain-containing protein [Thiotrichaceae bacterium]
MYLVDTSVWIDYINNVDAQHVEFLDNLLKNPLAVGLTDLVYMEILQGVKDQKTFELFQRYFEGQRFYRFDNPLESHTEAAQIFFNCRRKGVTVRSTIDCLIAQSAIEHDLILLHNDKDFIHMGRIVETLQQKYF